MEATTSKPEPTLDLGTADPITPIPAHYCRKGVLNFSGNLLTGASLITPVLFNSQLGLESLSILQLGILSGSVATVALALLIGGTCKSYIPRQINPSHQMILWQKASLKVLPYRLRTENNPLLYSQQYSRRWPAKRWCFIK